jgi:hypothetical protein
MIDAKDRYITLEKKLIYTRWINLGLESAEEDYILEQMDAVWLELTPEEQDILSSEPIPQTLLDLNDMTKQVMIDRDVIHNPGPVRTKVV